MKTRTAASKLRSAGITLTEVLISILILGVGLVSLATLFPTVSRAGVNRDDRSDDGIHETRPGVPQVRPGGFFLWSGMKMGQVGQAFQPDPMSAWQMGPRTSPGCRKVGSPSACQLRLKKEKRGVAPA